ncbi:MAG: N-acyl homoserine lactonase family protein [Candidatus Tectomicrobia bacterium]|nr:N-acyl homoserine lactonase family protein [Candidatus Tectomicrobia bacterium]
MPYYKIHPMVTVETPLAKSVFTYLLYPGEMLTVPAVSFLIEGGKKAIIVDSAGSQEDMRNNSQFGAPWRHVHAFEDLLGKHGLTPDDVEIVIQTHLHFDHVLNTQKCRNAEIIVQEDELRHAGAPHPITAKMYRWFNEHGKDLNYHPVRGEYEVAPGINLVPVPGHTEACQAVVVKTAQGAAVISGFCSIDINFNPPPEIAAYQPVICPGIHLNAELAYASTLKAKRLGDFVIPLHEPRLKEMQSIG